MTTAPVSTPSTPRLAAGLSALAAIVILSMLGVWQLAAPAPSDGSAPPTDFSTARALEHIQVIAREPHPVGSPANERVRDYLVAELNELGLQPEVQTATLPRRGPDGVTVDVTVQNIIARLPGTAPSKAILIVAHYDSVMRGPGASDDGAGVAALLEALRAVRSGQPLRNDVIVLFTDGEERGLIGAQAYVQQQAALDEIGLVLNFEARGNAGPTYMFEVSDENGWLVREFAAATSYPIGFSFTFDIYRLLPNITDFTVFRQAGIPGLNFAFIDGFVNYHMPSDTVENLDRRSLQHHGLYALELLRHLGDRDLTDVREPNMVYFTLLGPLLVSYPQTWAIPATVLVALLVVAVLALGLRRRRLTIRGSALGLLALLLSIIVGVLLVLLALMVIPLLHSGPLLLPQQGATYNSKLYALAFVLLNVASTALLYGWFRRWTTALNLAAGALLWWLLLMVLTTIYLPGTSYLFTWPLLGALLALALNITARDASAPWLIALTILLPAIPGLLLLAPFIYGLFIALMINLYPAMALFVVLLSGLLMLALEYMTAGRRWLLPVAALIVALNLIIFAGLTAGVAA